MWHGGGHHIFCNSCIKNLHFFVVEETRKPILAQI